jgi:hypothetical protein
MLSKSVSEAERRHYVLSEPRACAPSRWGLTIITASLCSILLACSLMEIISPGHTDIVHEVAWSQEMPALCLKLAPPEPVENGLET